MADNYPTIDKQRTGMRLKKLMEERGISVKAVQEYLGLTCVQSVYHWLDGSSMPSLDNLYALSELLRVPIDVMLCGNRSYIEDIPCTGAGIRLLAYYIRIRECNIA